MKHATLAHYKNHVDTRLRNRLIIYLVLSAIMIGLFAYYDIADRVSLWYPILALIIGFGIGIFISRSRNLSWDASSRKVVSNIDVYGFIIILLYVLSYTLREQIIGYFVHGSSILAVTFAFAAGIMFGRVWGIHGKVSEVIGHNL